MADGYAAQGKPLKLHNTESIPPTQNIPEPNPERPLPGVPIPGEMGKGGGKRGVYKCKICGKIFSSKEELDLHLKLTHSSEK